LLVAAIPALISAWLLSTQPAGDIRHYAPQWSDEIYNWHQVATFRAVGFEGGYYTAYEKPAPLSFTHFYNHGPVYPVLLGMLARTIDWRLYSTPILNVVIVTLAIVFSTLVTRPGISQLLFLGLTLATFWPLHLYMVTDMRLAFFSALAIVLAVFFCRTISDPNRASPFFLVIFGALIVLAAISKVTWSFLFFPFFLHIRQRLHLNFLQAVAISCVLVLASFLLYNQLAAPYPNFAGYLLRAFGRSFVDGVILLSEHAWFSLGDFFDPDHRLLWLMLRLQMLVSVFWAGFLLWRHRDVQEYSRECSVVIASSGSLIVLTILLYDVSDWRDFRLFAPALLLSMLIFIDRRRLFLVGVLLTGNLAVLPDFIAAHETIFTQGRFSENRDRLNEFVQQISPVIQFDDQKDGWGNTILVQRRVAIDPLVIGIPEGIGISWFKSAEGLPRVRSRYAILDPHSYQILSRRTKLEFVERTVLGDLYVNRTPETGESKTPE
jgi:hypothetical protein